MVYTYTIGESIHINITNKCYNNCVHCIKRTQDGFGGIQSLILKKEPSTDDIMKELETYDFSKYKEVVFSGFGDPLSKANEMLAICEVIKDTKPIRIRVNTTGLCDLNSEVAIAPKLFGLVDEVCVFLYAANVNDYIKKCKPRGNEEAYNSIFRFIWDARKSVPKVTICACEDMSEEDIQSCKETAQSLNTGFKIFPMVSSWEEFLEKRAAKKAADEMAYQQSLLEEQEQLEVTQE